MKKLFILLLFIVISIFTTRVGAQAKSKTVLYLYSPNCTHCVKFEPIYNKVSKAYADKCNFKKVDVRSAEGQKLMRKYRGFFIPYVLEIDDKTDYQAFILPDCLLNYACISQAIDDFIKK